MRTAKTTIRFQNAGVTLGTAFDTINLISGITAVDSGNGVAGLTGSGGVGTNVATEVVAATQSGNDITIDLTGLSHTYIAVEVVFRNGYGATPVTSWSKTGNTVTVFNASAQDDVFMVQYTY